MAVRTNAAIETLKVEATEEVASRRATAVKSAAEFNADIEAFQSGLASGYDDLAAQEARNVALAQLAERTISDAVSGTVTPVGLIGAGVTLLGILGLGATADNRRKDRVIGQLKTGESVTPAAS